MLTANGSRLTAWAEAALTISVGKPTAAVGGRIPVRVLSPALLALGEPIADASVLIDR